MSEHHLMTRKELAAIIGVTVNTVLRNETNWGLSSARVTLSRTCIRYRRPEAIRSLRLLGVLPMARDN